jgi:hypothetical protein
MQPLGTLAEFLGAVGRFNLAGDGSGPRGLGTVPGMCILHGPGCTIEVPGDGDPKAEVMQAMISVTDEDFGMPVIIRMCRQQKWRMTDADSGMSFG